MSLREMLRTGSDRAPPSFRSLGTPLKRRGGSVERAAQVATEGTFDEMGGELCEQTVWN